MELFLDTSTDKIIFGLINDNKKVVAFKKIASNKDMVKMTNLYLDIFLRENNINPKNDIKAIYFTIGPGSFTGIKVSYLIAKTFALANLDITFYIINTLELLENKETKTIIQIAKNNFYYYKEKNLFERLFNKSNKDKEIVFAKHDPKFKKQTINFNSFTDDDLEKKLLQFKQKKIEDIELLYVNNI